MSWKKTEFVVTIELCGRHPYREDHLLDYFPGFRYRDVTVRAKSFNHAASVALRDIKRLLPTEKAWSYMVVRVEVEPRARDYSRTFLRSVERMKAQNSMTPPVSGPHGSSVIP